MDDYIDPMLDECPQDLLKGSPVSPSANHLFDINPDCDRLGVDVADEFHHFVAKLIYLAKRPDILLVVAFLCTRVNDPDTNGYKNWAGACHM